MEPGTKQDGDRNKQDIAMVQANATVRLLCSAHDFHCNLHTAVHRQNQSVTCSNGLHLIRIAPCDSHVEACAEHVNCSK